jgi:acylphosphatase
MPTIHLIIQGRVQGVFFRASARDLAQSLKLQGWVKNTIGGDVEILASGQPDKLEKFTEWCRQGPPDALVQKVLVTELQEQSLSPGFTIIR